MASDQYAWWSNATVDYLFDNAEELGFKIFFSFDMSGDYFATPSQYAEYLDGYLSRDSYYTYNGKANFRQLWGNSSYLFRCTAR